MSYLVEYTGTGTEGQVEPQGPPVYWKNGDVKWVADECMAFYLSNSSVFTVIKDQSSTKDLVSEGAAGLAYVVECIAADEGKAAVIDHLESMEGMAATLTHVQGEFGKAITVDVIEEGFPGNRGAAYIDFNATGEAGLAITIGSFVYQEADTADAANGVFTNGASAADSATSLIAAINGDERTTPTITAAADLSGDGVWLYSNVIAASAGSITTSVPPNLTAQPAAKVHFFDAGEPGMSVVIGGVSYTEADTAAPTTGVWTNGASASDSATSLAAAINGDTRAAVPFTAYALADNVFIKWDDAEETDPFVISETSAANCSVYQASFMPFSATGAPETTVTIGGIVFQEADPADAPNGVWTNGASAANSTTSLAAAINGDTRTTLAFNAVPHTGGESMWIAQNVVDEAAAAITIAAPSMSCTTQAFSGGADSAVKKIVNITHAVSANELLSGHIDFPLAFAPETWTVQAYTATGAPIYFTDAVSAMDDPTDLIRITTEGATNLAATDVVHLVVVG